MVAVVLLAIAGYAVTRGGARENEARMVTVTYEVTGAPGKVEVRYNDSNGDLSSPQTVTLPWKTQITVREGTKTLLRLRVERAESSGGALACRITSEGKSIDNVKSHGDFVACGGFVDEN
ncbi:MmpS family transport accessory protein [Mycobacterium shimoidei]|uniref:MmpS family transport accessory protein n=1 Tax=Mycobacterium shimoidei TaxID=29313 RepID=UPI0008494422|nr:MmpS family transport accessory protein [Mycobacterium shimoidei]MCV7259627.1 hypothetical protein [Mycobacterium shimoidei]ODR12201.1 hypothetical protein BHQ16_16765 [Mycobacterium shimoidei]ORW78023.1 hypothetical protein AWC26_18535 [Mycobacterium shimoidei]